MQELEREPSRTPATAGVAALPPLAVIGRGRAGGALERAARAAGLAVRSAGRGDVLAACGDAEVALLAVPDDAIADVCAEVSAAVPPLRHVGHVSGATSLDALAPAAARGAGVFSLHPLQTLTGRDSSLAGAACAIAGADEVSLALAERLADALGMRPFHVAEEERAAYHAAAAMASNFLVALEEAATRLLDATGVADARELLAPLVLRTAANWAGDGPGALTGPIARGDEATVARHREALTRAAPDLLELYDALAHATRRLADSPIEAAP